MKRILHYSLLTALLVMLLSASSGFSQTRLSQNTLLNPQDPKLDRTVGTAFDYTTYDWQSNSGARNWTIVWPDGKVNVAFTYASNTSYSDRGTAIATYNSNTGEWISAGGRVENEKTGFGSICRYGTNSIVVAAHTSTKCGVYLVPDKDNITPGCAIRLSYLNTAKDPSWPVVMTSGPNRDIIHVVATGGSDNKMYYYRSTDCGTTWDKENVTLPYLTSPYGTYWRSNSCYFMETTDDNCLALVVNSAWSDGMVLYSYDNGETWQRKMFYQHTDPTASYDDSDRFYYPRWTSCQWDDQHKLQVLYEFNTASGDPGGTNYHKEIGGVAFWSETLLYNENGNTTSILPGNLTPGSPFVLEDAYIKNDICLSYLSSSYTYNPTHSLWPEYMGYLPPLDDFGNVMSPYQLEDFNLFDVDERMQHAEYYQGICGFPVLCKAPNNGLVAVWSALDENCKHSGGYYYYHLFANYSPDGGHTWGNMVNLCAGDDYSLYEQSEMIYPQAAVVGNTLIVAAMVDGMPGAYAFADDGNAYDNCYMGWTFDINELFHITPSSALHVAVRANPASYGTVTGGGDYEPGETVTVTATPNGNHPFVNWTEYGEVVSTNPTYTFVINDNRNLVANFEYATVTAEYYPDPDDPYQHVLVNWEVQNVPNIDRYVLYRTTCNDNGSYTILGEYTETAFIDLSWSTLDYGSYKYGVSCIYDSGRSTPIVWSQPQSLLDQNITVAEGNSTGPAPFVGSIPEGFEKPQLRSSDMEANITYNGYYFGHFTLNDPANVTLFDFSRGNWMNGACYMNDEFYFASSYGEVGKYSPETGFAVLSTHSYGIHTIEYNPADGKLYGMNSYGYLYEITPHLDGFTYTFVASMGTSYALAFTIDQNGLFIIADAGDDYIKTYDLTTGTLTNVLAAGFDINYGQDMAVDPETNEVYWAACNNTDDTYPLFIVDLDNASLELIGYFNGQATGLAINDPIITVPSITYSSCITKPRPQYTINASVSPAETGWVDGAGIYEEGTTAYLYAFANNGFRFVNWTDSGEGLLSLTEGFENGFPSNWTTIDADGDGHNWGLISNLYSGYSGHETSNGISSQSYVGTVGGVYPDNYLVTPKVQLGGVFTFWACAHNTNYASETFGVAVSTSGNTDPSSFTMVNQWTMTAKGVEQQPKSRETRAQGTWYQYTVDLGEYAGQIGYIAIRHFDSYDEWAVDLDDIAYVVAGESEVVSTSSSYWFTVTADRNLVANFERLPITYQINATPNPEEGGYIYGAGSYYEGAEVNLAAYPNDGYQFVNWTENGVVVSDAATYQFTASSDRDLMANFEQLAPTEYTITLSVNPANSGVVYGDGVYVEGETILLTAEPNTGYHFVGWTIGGETLSVDPYFEFTAYANLDIVAQFDLDKFNITTIAFPEEGGVVGTGILVNETFENYVAGDYLAEASFAQGNTWWTTWNNIPSSVEDGLIEDLNGNLCAHFVRGNDQIFNVSNANNGIYTVEFDVLVPEGKMGYFNLLHRFDAGSSTWAVQVYLNGTSSGYDPGHGQVDAGGTYVCDLPCVSDQWMHFRLYVNADSDYAQIYFNVEGQPEQLMYTWQWSMQAISTYYSGTTLAAIDFFPPFDGVSEFYVDNLVYKKVSSVYNYGEEVTVHASPSTGYNFINWEENGEVVSEEDHFSFVVYEDRYFVGNFELKSFEITATVNPADGGMVHGTGSFDYGETATLTAVPEEGYQFVNWTENGMVVSYAATYQFTVSSGRDLVANFEMVASEYTVTLSVNPANSGVVSGGGVFLEGETILLTAEPNTGYHFVGWTIGGETLSVDPYFELGVYGDMDIVAQFDLDKFNITTIANPREGGVVGTGVLVNETFEYYAEGDYLSEASFAQGNTWWTTWTNQPGSVEDGMVEELNGNLCAHFTAHNDQIFNVSNANSGVYTIEFDALVPEGKMGYFNLLHHFDAWNSTWAVQVYLNATGNGSIATPSAGHGTVFAGSNNTCDLPCVYDEWMHFRLLVDADNDVAKFYFNVAGQPEQLMCTWQWSLDSFGNFNAGTTLAAIDFFPPYSNLPESEWELCEFFVDNLVYNKVSSIYNYGEEVTVNASPAMGYNFVNWTEGVEVLSEEDHYSFVVYSDRTIVGNFETKQFEITATVNPEEGGAVFGIGVYNYGETAILTAVPEEGYQFVNWTENGSLISSSSTYQFTVSMSRALVANFELVPPTEYTVTATVSPANAGAVDGTGIFEEGSEVTLTATAADGYEFVGWMVGDEIISENPYSFILTEGVEVIALFEEVIVPPTEYTVTVELNPAEAGSVTGAGTFEENTEVTLTATAAEGYEFLNWMVGEETITENPYSFMLTEDVDVVANFELLSFEVTAEANPAEGGEVAGAGTYNYGETATLTATAAEGYAFVNWTENGEIVDEDAAVEIVVTEAHALVANFELLSFEVTAEANPAEGGEVAGAGTYNYGETATLTATAAEGYVFVNWTENGEIVGEDAAVEIVVTEAHALVANFELLSFEVTAEANPAEGGEVAGAGTYNYGETATLTATAAEGYVFVNWTVGDEVITENPYSFEVMADVDVVANFELLSFEVTAEANPAEGGEIAGAGTYNYGETATLTATAAEGYVFVNWTENGEIVGEDVAVEIVVTEAHALVANFEVEVIRYTITIEPVEHGFINAPAMAEAEEVITVVVHPEPMYSLVALYYTIDGTDEVVDIDLITKQFVMPAADITIEGEFELVVDHGDVNLDGLVNVVDIVAVFNYILEKDPQPFDFDQADMNEDGVIDISDAMAINALILGLKAECGDMEVVFEVVDGQLYLDSEVALAGYQFRLSAEPASINLAGFNTLGNWSNGEYILIVYNLSGEKEAGIYSVLNLGDATLNSIVMSTKEGCRVRGNAGTVSVASFNEDNYSVYPVPANNEVTVAGPEMTTVEVFNLMGQKVMTVNVNGDETVVNVSTLTAGNYLFRINTANGVTVKSVVIVR